MNTASAENKTRTGDVREGRLPRKLSRGKNLVAEPVRGYIKLSSAARAFGFVFKDKIVLDIGSSTGGFTEYALEQGAKKVIAVEKGTNQMKSPLRHDPRVELHEKTDIFGFKLGADLSKTSISRNVSRFASPETSIPDGTERFARQGGSLGCPAYDVEGEQVYSKKRLSDKSVVPSVILADVSFISLTKILKYAKENLANKNTDFLVMLKPQFEAKPHQLQSGIVKNEKIRRELIKDFESYLKSNNFIIVKKRDNALQGKHGNTERFYWLKLGKD